MLSDLAVILVSSANPAPALSSVTFTANLTAQSKTLLMEWCIECHRAPEKNLRPKSEVFSMPWNPGKGGKWQPEDFPHYGQQADGSTNPLVGQDRPTSQKEIGATLKEQYQVRDAVTMTNCSMCHR